MSERPQLVPFYNWRVSDAAAVWQAFNTACFMIGSKDVSDSVIARRLRLLSGWAAAAADRMDERDVEGDAIAEIDSFFAARTAGARGDDGR